MSDHYLIACAADSQKGYFDTLSKQVVAAGIDFLYQPLPDFSWKRLVDWEHLVASSYPDALIAFCDAWDMLYFGSRKEFKEVISAQPLLLHAEKVCWPDSWKADKYPATSSPWRYVNGTGPAGLGSAIAEAIEHGMKHFPIRDHTADVTDISKDNDQRFWTDVYFAGYGKLDSECKLSQSLVQVAAGDLAVKDGRLVNKVTGSKPLFVHANGNGAMLGQKGLMDILAMYRPEGQW